MQSEDSDRVSIHKHLLSDERKSHEVARKTKEVKMLKSRAAVRKTAEMHFLSSKRAD